MSANGRSVLVTLDKERHLRYTVNALCDLETVLGCPLGEMQARGLDRLLGTVRACVWAGLRHEDATLTLAGTGEMLQGFVEQGGDLGMLGQPILDALGLAGFKTGAEPSTEAASPLASASGLSASSPSPSATSG